MRHHRVCRSLCLIQSEASFVAGPPGGETFSITVRLHNMGNIAASCTVEAGGQKKVTGVSASGDATVVFDGLT